MLYCKDSDEHQSKALRSVGAQELLGARLRKVIDDAEGSCGLKNAVTRMVPEQVRARQTAVAAESRDCVVE